MRRGEGAPLLHITEDGAHFFMRQSMEIDQPFGRSI